MKLSIAKSVLSVAIMSATLAVSSPDASSAQGVDVNSLALSGDKEFWHGYTYHANDHVGSGSDILSYAAEKTHNILGMDERGPMARLLYVATVGQVVFRASWANSIMAHEYAHFANAHRFGLTDHYFQSESSGNTFKWDKAWMRIFTNLSVGGPATSSAGPGGFNQDLYDERGVEHALAGLNWQMQYSEKRMRGWLSGERKTFLDWPDMVLNRMYTMTYAMGTSSSSGEDQNGVKNDILMFADHMELTRGESNVTNRVATISTLANLLSPNLLSMVKSLPQYVVDGTVEAEPFIFKTKSGHGFTWDIPHYLNLNSMTVVPTVYWLPNEKYKDLIGATNLVVGAGLETSVIGRSESEARITVDADWGRFGVETGMSFGGDGQFAEITASYKVAKHAQISVGVAHQFGDTLRGARNLPDAESVVWAGVKILF